MIHPALVFRSCRGQMLAYDLQLMEDQDLKGFIHDIRLMEG